MDLDSQPISNSPYYVIRTEKYPIHSVCVGSPLSVFTTDLPQNSPLLASTASDIDNDPESAFEAFAGASQTSRQPQYAHSKGTTGFGNKVSTISAPVGSKGIFDSSSEDEATEDVFETPESGDLSRNASKEGDIGPIKTRTSPSGQLLATSRLIITGSSTGSLSVFESGSGRLLDRVENAHGPNSVLCVEELQMDSNGAVLIASQGRDGYVRFWSIKLEKGTTTFPTLPDFSVRGERMVLRPHSSPVFVGGEAFCKASFNKHERLVATTVDRGAIAVWDYESVLNRSAKGDVPFAPKCIISYEGDKYGMCMSLQLISSTEKRDTALLAGFEDGSILAWSLVAVDLPDAPGKSSSSFLYTLVASSRPFATTPVLSFFVRQVSELLAHQSLTPDSDERAEKRITIDASNASDLWVGVATSAEDTIATFCFSWETTAAASGNQTAELKILETAKTPHQGYGDVKIRSDSLVALAGWDHRIRLFLLEATGSSLSQISFQLRSLAILRHHSASVHSISLGEPETKLLASGSKDERIALWNVY